MTHVRLGSPFARLGAAAGVLALITPCTATAQSAEDLDRARARAIAGTASLEAKAYGTALSECEDALRIIDAPTILLCKARALVGLDRLDDARATYRALLDKPLQAGSPPAWADARKSAESELSDATKALLDRYQRVFSTKLDAKQFDAALEAAEKSLAVERTVVAALGRARALAGLERFSDALGAFDAALALIDKVGAPSGLDRGAVQNEATSVRQNASIELVGKGSKRLSERDFQGALSSCKAAEGFGPTAESALCNARALTGLGRLEEATRDYETLLADSPHPPNDAQRSQANAELADIRRKLGPAKLTLRGTQLPGLRVVVDGNAPQELAGDRSLELVRGTHSIRAAAPGYVPLVEVFDLKGGEDRAFPIDLRPLPPLRLAGWVSLGVGVAGLATSGVLASQVVSQNNTLVEACNANLECGTSSEAAIQSLAGLRVGTFIAGGVGAAAVLASGTLHLLAPSDRMPDAPKVSLGINGINVTGAF